MAQILEKLKSGYQAFREQYAKDPVSLMRELGTKGQAPQVMVIACSDSRVDPALVLQSDPGDLFVVRNVANIVPPYEKDNRCHGTSAALEYGVRHLQVKHLIIMGHSHCGGIETLMKQENIHSDFIEHWVECVADAITDDVDICSHAALHQSYKHCLTFPWIKERVDASKLQIHRWFFDIKSGTINAYEENSDCFVPLCPDTD
jgi:carbonic anhydrase